MQVEDLTPDDPRGNPIWEFALDEEGEERQDEAALRPVEHSDPLDPSDGMFVVRASFTLADGSRKRRALREIDASARTSRSP